MCKGNVFVAYFESYRQIFFIFTLISAKYAKSVV